VPVAELAEERTNVTLGCTNGESYVSVAFQFALLAKDELQQVSLLGV
jgi:hypothetical protein